VQGFFLFPLITRNGGKNCYYSINMSIEVQTITIFNRNDFRKWLKKYHKKESKVAVVIHKKHTGKTSPTHRELIEEAICFGWIDTTIKRLDEDTFLRNFSKRNQNSRWSDNTLRYARELIKKGLMTEEGIKFYKLGAAKPTHDHGIPKNPDMPPELIKALSKNKKAKENFDKYPPSTKRTMYRWLLQAKLPETRDKRLKRIVESAKSNNKNLFGPNTKANS
jgi:uncharacterized protein YdeI (YjbR/CyaY-like superfamily)